MTETITQKYIRRYPNSKRTKSWAGRMVYIRTENGVWRNGGHGYTQIGKSDAWVLPFEEAVNQVAHCGPEKQAAFIAAADLARSPVGDLYATDFSATGFFDEEIICGENLGRSGFVFEVTDDGKFAMFVLKNDDASRLADVLRRPFQPRVAEWMLACFGEEIASDRMERNHRFLEESLELVQANGCTQSEAHQLVDYVFNRPVGELEQEVGGVMVTLAALCGASDADMQQCGDRELARVWKKMNQIRAKQAAKPDHSPLPGDVPC